MLILDAWIHTVILSKAKYFGTNCEDHDLQTISNHAFSLAGAGIAGVTDQVSNGEAVHLSIVSETRSSQCAPRPPLGKLRSFTLHGSFLPSIGSPKRTLVRDDLL